MLSWQSWGCHSSVVGSSPTLASVKGDGARKILLVYSTVNPSTYAKMLVKLDREVVCPMHLRTLKAECIAKDRRVK